MVLLLLLMLFRPLTIVGMSSSIDSVATKSISLQQFASCFLLQVAAVQLKGRCSSKGIMILGALGAQVNKSRLRSSSHASCSICALPV